MKRRRFLNYTSLAIASFAINACQSIDNLSETPDKTDSSLETVNFGKLEKPYLTLGFIPTTDATPLIIGQKEGFFERYGLQVSFSKKATWQDIREGLLDGSLDAACTPFGMPMQSQLGASEAPMISLMTLNLHGSSITFDRDAWEAGMRPFTDYVNFRELTRAYREYIRGFNQALPLAIEDNTSMDAYLTRYWLAAMGLNPNEAVELIEIPPSEMIYKLQAGMVNSYAAASPWNEQAVLQKAGFTVNTSREIWTGHPGQVLATMQPWVDQNSVTARALVAAVLEACQFCDASLKHRNQIASILAQPKYLDTNILAIEPSLVGVYDYGGFDGKSRVKKIPDYYSFHDGETDYLKKPDHVNYSWRSHGVWLLTQMIRWNQLPLTEYPADADDILDRIYPLDVYQEVAEALEIELPSDRLKFEPASHFIDQHAFDPSQPVAYLNTFDLRANAPQLFALG
ncbi:MAG: CmpA/NrtA family ABC transporter substrate-binding protein [Chroococcales cyanobacterium]